MTKRILFALLAILLVLALVPVAAQAHGGDDEGTTTSQGPGDDDDDDRDDDRNDRDDHDDDRNDDLTDDDRDDDDDDRDDDDRDDDDDDRDDDGRRRRASADDDPSANDARTPAPAPTGSTGAADGGAGGTSSTPVQVTVDIVDRRFSPATVSVPVGSTVTWRNNDDRPHTATGETFDSGIVDTGRTFRTTFESPGTFAYICELHPEMRGTVTVGGQGDSPATTAGTTHAAPGSASSDRTAASVGGTTAAAGDGAGNDARTGGRSAPAATHDVSIVDFAFDAAALEVHAGDRIRWTNDGSAPHTATAEGAFDSGILESGQTFTTQLDDRGTIEYRCLLHPDMVATVTVVVASSGTSPNGAGETRGTGDGAADATASRAETGSNTADAAGPGDVATSSSGTQAATSGRTAPGLLVAGFVLLAAALITGLNRFLRMAADESH